MQERQLTIDRDDQQTVRFRDRARHLGQELGPGHAHGDGQADLLEDLSAEANRDLRGRPEIFRSPPTSRNASSIDSPSTNGVVSLNTSNIALLAAL